MVASRPGVGRIVVTISPGARRSELVGRHGDAWKFRIAAAPERGRANAELIDFVARILAVQRDDVAIVSGYASRRKIVEVGGVETEELGRRLARAGKS
jgi:uncharacterized protein (TIGR00251 family)